VEILAELLPGAVAERVALHPAQIQSVEHVAEFVFGDLIVQNKKVISTVAIELPKAIYVIKKC
jgi:hypothetical protein